MCFQIDEFTLYFKDFTKEVISIVGSTIGKDNELCFPSFKNKTTKQVQKRHKGISG